MDAAARDCSEQHKRGNAVLASYAYIKISTENRTDRRRSLFPSLVRKFWLFSVVIADRNAKTRSARWLAHRLEPLRAPEPLLSAVEQPADRPANAASEMLADRSKTLLQTMSGQVECLFSHISRSRSTPRRRALCGTISEFRK